MTPKDQHELTYWTKRDRSEHKKKYPLYLKWWGYSGQRFYDIVDVGCGPFSGFCPYVNAHVKIALDPLWPEYERAGFEKLRGVSYDHGKLESFHGPVNAVFCSDTLDHGDLGFHMIPKLASLLDYGGRLYLHVHLRPPKLLNTGHDHALKEKDLDKALKETDLIELKRGILPNDIDGKFCKALMGVWLKPFWGKIPWHQRKKELCRKIKDDLRRKNDRASGHQAGQQVGHQGIPGTQQEVPERQGPGLRSWPLPVQ